MECMPGAFVAAADEEDNNGHIHKYIWYNIQWEPDRRDCIQNNAGIY